MLSAERNTFMTQVGPGTPMGELFRRFWLPVMVTEQFPEPDGEPARIRVLGEDLVAFRDSNGRMGVVDAFCPHRRAPLFFGRNEECGLRCVYHGWKFDVEGTCVDMPSEPPESDFKERITIKSYPLQEEGGAIWIYMGPPEAQPPLPLLEFVGFPGEQRMVGMWIVEANWLQVLEGNVDTAHVSFLHSANEGIPGVREEGLADKAPELMVIENDVGFAYGGRRAITAGGYYWRVTQFLLPTWTLIPNPSGVGALVGVVPIDDHHALRVQIAFNPDGPVVRRAPMTGREQGEFRFPDGVTIDTWLPNENRTNRYGLDRDRQRRMNYSGIEGIETQDRAMTEGMGYVCDRTQEHLGTSDLAVIATRRLLERLAQNLERGHAPAAVGLPHRFGARPLDVIAAEDNLGDVLATHAEAVRMHAVAP